jgi:hypothetical protein
MRIKNADSDLKSQLSGWSLFIAGCLLFTVSSIRNGDLLGSLASLLFLGGCVAFIRPLLGQLARRTRR